MMEGHAPRVGLHTHRAFGANLSAAQEALCPWQMSVPESIWNHFSDENLGQKWGRVPPGWSVFFSKYVSGREQTECTSSRVQY